MLRLLVNLDTSPDRLDWMRAEFGRFDLDFQRVPAVNRDAVTEEIMRAMARPRLDGVTWSPAEIACFLSHRECWKIAAEAGESHVAILEDDVHLAPAAATFLRDAAWIPAGVDIVKLETYQQVTRLRRDAVPIGQHLLSEIRARHWGSAGYVIAASAARRLLDQSEHFNKTVDEFLFDPWGREKSFNCYQIEPAICVQDGHLFGEESRLPSVIESDRVQIQGLPSRPVKRKGLNKALRELTRPFEQLGKKTVELVRFAFHGERTLEVPFDQPGNTARERRKQARLQARQEQ